MSNDSPYEKARQYVERHEADHLGGRLRYLNGPCITISRETGAGANFVCDALLQHYESVYPPGECPWAVFEKNLIDRVVADYNLPEKIKTFLGEQKYATMQTVMNELLGLHPPLIKLQKQIAETILKLAYTGYCIIVGRGSNLITANVKQAFHVRLIAPYEHRLKHMMQHYAMDHQAAEAFIKSEDVKRAKYIETYFHKNAADPHLYDLTINTGKLGFSDCAVLIADAVAVKNKIPVYTA